MGSETNSFFGHVLQGMARGGRQLRREKLQGEADQKREDELEEQRKFIRERDTAKSEAATSLGIEKSKIKGDALVNAAMASSETETKKEKNKIAGEGRALRDKKELATHNAGLKSKTKSKDKSLTDSEKKAGYVDGSYTPVGLREGALLEAWYQKQIGGGEVEGLDRDDLFKMFKSDKRAGTIATTDTFEGYLKQYEKDTGRKVSDGSKKSKPFEGDTQEKQRRAGDKASTDAAAAEEIQERQERISTGHQGLDYMNNIVQMSNGMFPSHQPGQGDGAVPEDYLPAIGDPSAGLTSGGEEVPEVIDITDQVDPTFKFDVQRNEEAGYAGSLVEAMQTRGLTPEEDEWLRNWALSVGIQIPGML